ncbi:hypothetical protein Tco_1429537 [Tanacetum coccineum]
MDTIRAKQIALDDALVAPANQLKIRKSNFRLCSNLKSKEATLQVVYIVLKLTPFYKAFQISANVPEIYIQEFWATATVHHHSIQAILTFLRDLSHSGEIKMITDVNVNKLHQPWRSFAVEDFVYQVENKKVKKSNEMYYPRFTKVIVNFFMTKDQSIPRWNSVNWHYVRDDYMFTMIKVVSRHEDTQLNGAILPNELTNEDIRNSKSYKEYYAIASGAVPLKTKASVKKMQVKSDTSKTPPTIKGKRLKISAEADKPAKKKQPAKTSKAKGLTVLSEVALTEAEQLKLATKRSLIQTHISHASGSGANEGTGSIPGVSNVPTYDSDNEQISWKSSEEDNEDEVNDDDNNDDDDNDDDVDKDINDDNSDNQDDDDEQTNSDNDGDDFVHPKLSTHDDEARKEDEVNEEESNEENDDESNEESDKEVKGVNNEDKEMDEEVTHEKDKANELYRDVNVNLEGRDTVMTDASLPNV